MQVLDGATEGNTEALWEPDAEVPEGVLKAEGWGPDTCRVVAVILRDKVLEASKTLWRPEPQHHK